MNKYKLIPSLFILLGILSVFSYIYAENPGDNAYVQSLYLVPTFLSVLFGFSLLNVSGWKGKKSNIFLLMVIGIGLWLVGDILWAIYILILDLDPFPSYIDIVYLSGYIFLFLAFCKEYKLNKIIWQKKQIVYYAILFSVLTWLTGYYGVYMAYDSEATLWENVFSIAYGIADLILIAIILLILMIVRSYQKGKFTMPWTYILLGMIFTIFADLLYALYYVPYEEGVHLYQLIDLGWIFSFLFFAQGFNQFREIILDVHKKIKIQ